jgi:hypothetical protein
MLAELLLFRGPSRLRSQSGESMTEAERQWRVAELFHSVPSEHFSEAIDAVQP